MKGGGYFNNFLFYFSWFWGRSEMRGGQRLIFVLCRKKISYGNIKKNTKVKFFILNYPALKRGGSTIPKQSKLYLARYLKNVVEETKINKLPIPPSSWRKDPNLLINLEAHKLDLHSSGLVCAERAFHLFLRHATCPQSDMRLNGDPALLIRSSCMEI